MRRRRRAASARGERCCKGQHDARCGLPIFLQQVTLINQRLGKASDQRQIEALFGATQVQGYVDFADFLSRESTRAYFAMGMEYAA